MKKILGIFLIVMMIASFGLAVDVQEDCDKGEKLVNGKCVPKDNGSGFVLHKDKTILGLTSYFDGNGWGTPVGFVSGG